MCVFQVIKYQNTTSWLEILLLIRVTDGWRVSKYVMSLEYSKPEILTSVVSPVLHHSLPGPEVLSPPTTPLVTEVSLVCGSYLSLLETGSVLSPTETSLFTSPDQDPNKNIKRLFLHHSHLFQTHTTDLPSLSPLAPTQRLVRRRNRKLEDLTSRRHRCASFLTLSLTPFNLTLRSTLPD